MFIIAKEITKKNIKNESIIDLNETNIINNITNGNNDSSNETNIINNITNGNNDISNTINTSDNCKTQSKKTKKTKKTKTKEEQITFNKIQKKTKPTIKISLEKKFNSFIPINDKVKINQPKYNYIKLTAGAELTAKILKSTTKPLIMPFVNSLIHITATKHKIPIEINIRTNDIKLIPKKIGVTLYGFGASIYNKFEIFTIDFKNLGIHLSKDGLKYIILSNIISLCMSKHRKIFNTCELDLRISIKDLESPNLEIILRIFGIKISIKITISDISDIMKFIKTLMSKILESITIETDVEILQLKI